MLILPSLSPFYRGRAGKTSTVNSLLSLSFNPNETSTVGCVSTEVRLQRHDVTRWRSPARQGSEVARILAAMSTNESVASSTQDVAPTERDSRIDEELQKAHHKRYNSDMPFYAMPARRSASAHFSTPVAVAAAGGGKKEMGPAAAPSVSVPVTGVCTTSAADRKAAVRAGSNKDVRLRVGCVC
jgi:hypothetical protein